MREQAVSALEDESGQSSQKRNKLRPQILSQAGGTRALRVISNQVRHSRQADGGDHVLVFPSVNRWQQSWGRQDETAGTLAREDHIAGSASGGAGAAGSGSDDKANAADEQIRTGQTDG